MLESLSTRSKNFSFLSCEMWLRMTAVAKKCDGTYSQRYVKPNPLIRSHMPAKPL